MTRTAFYLGPGRPLAHLRAWADLHQAAAGGLLGEHQWIELKEQLAPGKVGNIELAKDLASLAVDGGIFVIGITDKTQLVVGVSDYEKLATRISQVAASAVTPPLSPVIYDPVLNPDYSESAVLIVEVPASATAPHMVANSYWGRSAEGKRALTDPEVRRLLDARRTSETDFRTRLLAMADNDPLTRLVLDGPTGHGHVYLLAEPLAAIQNPSEPDVYKTLRNIPAAGPLDDCRYDALARIVHG